MVTLKMTRFIKCPLQNSDLPYLYAIRLLIPHYQAKITCS